MPLIATRGAASAQGFGEFGAVAGPAVYIEDVFSTYLYTGNGSTQTITNGIDLAGKGGLVWIKGRSGATGHRLTDTARGATNSLESNSTAAQATEATGLTAFSGTGFTIGADADYNTSSATYVSWAFREQAKFFDVVTYTGNGANRTIAHNLGSVPGCIIVKATSGPTATTNWGVYHRSIGNTRAIFLNNTDAQATSVEYWNNTDPTATNFSVGTAGTTNGSGNTYVAYLFAHDAGGFGLTGTDNVISCGSYTGNGSATGPVVTLGYEPQWVIVKATSRLENWFVFDAMRGLTAGTAADALLQLNNASAELQTNRIEPTATGFSITSSNPDVNGSGDTYIYIAIRRGPMKVPTTGTSVFAPVTTTGTGTNSRVITGVGFSPDMIINCTRGATTLDRYTQDRLRGLTQTIYTNKTDAEQTGLGIYAVGTLDMTGFTQGTSAGAGFNSASDTYVFYNFRRAPGFFDEVCYTGTGSARTVTHNLAAVPELMIVKDRTSAQNWPVYCAYLGGANPANRYVWLNSSNVLGASAVYWNNTAPTASVFTVNTTASTNNAGDNYVAYLFASVAGVSKVGSYTGTGTTKQIDCGFTGGARFVLIKRTDGTGDWYVWDSARGIVAGNDPYLLLNSTAAEVTNTDYVDTYSAGFEISSTAPADINANGGTFIFLAIA